LRHLIGITNIYYMNEPQSIHLDDALPLHGV
jgi:hypothetical protein